MAGARAVVRVRVGVGYVDGGGGGEGEGRRKGGVGGKYEAGSYEGGDEGRGCEEKKKKEKEEEEEEEEEMVGESCEAWLHDGGKEPEVFFFSLVEVVW